MFDSGKKCCSTNRKANKLSLNKSCDGGDLLFDSICCAGTSIDCPIQEQFGGCLDLGKIINTICLRALKPKLSFR